MRVRVPTANPPVLKRVQRVNALLTNANGEVRLEIDPKCRELIKDLEEVLFKPDSGHPISYVEAADVSAAGTEVPER